MPDKYGFDHLPNWGVITLACIETGCDARGYFYEWPEERREEHYLSHHPRIRHAVEDTSWLDELPTMPLKG